MNLKSSKRSREWVKILPEVVAALNREETRLTGKKSKKRWFIQNHQSVIQGLKEKKRLDYSVNLRYLLSPGELEGGKKRASDPVWSLKVFNISKSIVNKDEPVLHYLNLSTDGPKRGFFREELKIVPKGTELPPN